METVRAVLIGFGAMGQFYAKLIYAGTAPGMRLTGICCRNAQGQEQIRQAFPGVKCYTSTDEMAAAAEEFDAVIIVTPHTSHIAIGLQMAALGKHIFLDKPAGLDAAQVAQLETVCREKGLTFAMMFNNRRLPIFQTAKKMLEEGRLGKLHRAVWICNNWYRSPAYHRSAAWRSSWQSEGGGMLVNQIPHNLDLWNWFFGLPQRVYASLEFGRYNDFTVDDAADVQLFYDDGFHGTLISATGEAPGVNRLEIWGSKGRLTLEDNQSLIFHENNMSTEEFGRINQEKFATIPFTSRDIPLDPPCNPYPQMFENFAAHLLRGTPLFATGMDGLRQVQLANAIYVSGWESCKVSLPVDPARYAAGLVQRQQQEAQE